MRFNDILVRIIAFTCKRRRSVSDRQMLTRFFGL